MEKERPIIGLRFQPFGNVQVWGIGNILLAAEALADDASVTSQNTYLYDFALAVESSVKEWRLGLRSALYNRACPVVELLRLVDGGNAEYVTLVRELHEQGHVASHLGL